MELPYDALVIVSFGGPEGMAEVMPFLENVLRGRNVPPERIRQVAHHYELFGGVSPINAQNRDLIAAIEREFALRGPRLPVYWGNRNWHPLLADTVRQMAEHGIRRALAFVTSAYSSYSGCRQYLESIARARAEVGPNAPRIEKLRAFYNHPGFIEANVDRVRAALESIPDGRREATRLVFTAHSIPLSMASGCEYQAQLEEASRLVAEGVGMGEWKLVYQSRSGPPSQPWLEPDICDYLRELASQGTADVVVSPVGFISDHMEVVYDLDVEAKQLAASLGLNLVRAATAGTHPSFVKMVRELVMERLDPGVLPRALGLCGPAHSQCGLGCCLPGEQRSTGAEARKPVLAASS